MNDKERDRAASGEDVVFVIPREIDGQPVREFTREFLKKLDGIKNATKIVIPDFVTSIEKYAFMHCGSLRSVVIPESVTSIGDGAFWGCRSLISVVIPNSVTSIGECAFSSCDKLMTIEASSSNANFQTSLLFPVE